MKVSLHDMVMFGMGIALVAVLYVVWGQQQVVSGLSCRINRMEVILYSGQPQPECKKEQQ